MSARFATGQPPGSHSRTPTRMLSSPRSPVTGDDLMRRLGVMKFDQETALCAPRWPEDRVGRSVLRPKTEREPAAFRRRSSALLHDEGASASYGPQQKGEEAQEGSGQ